MQNTTISHQLKNNFVAIVSLVVAITALTYTAWREELTERNRTLRTAGFEILMHLGELQIIVNQVRYQPEHSLADPYLGWGHISLIGDLSALLPPPVPSTTDKLIKTWASDWDKLKTSDEATAHVSEDIDAARQAVLHIIKTLK